jgi:hypothetical protein
VAQGELVNIEEVNDADAKNEFIRSTWKAYQGNPRWVPPLKSEVKSLLREKKSPFFQHAEASFLLARKNGETVGRIAAVIDRNRIATHNEPIDSSRGLLGAALCITRMREGSREQAPQSRRQRYRQARQHYPRDDVDDVVIPEIDRRDDQPRYHRDQNCKKPFLPFFPSVIETEQRNGGMAAGESIGLVFFETVQRILN